LIAAASTGTPALLARGSVQGQPRPELCIARQFSGNLDPTPDTAPGVLQLTVYAHSHQQAIENAE
jgi:hypothetical protein